MAGGGSVAVAVGVSDMLQGTGDTRHLTHDTWRLTPYTSHLTPDFFLSVQLSAHDEKFIVSQMRDFSNSFLKKNSLRKVFYKCIKSDWPQRKGGCQTGWCCLVFCNALLYFVLYIFLFSTSMFRARKLKLLHNVPLTSTF